MTTPQSTVAAAIALGLISCLTIYYLYKKTSNTNSKNTSSGLSKQYKPLKLIKKTSYNDNTIIFRFALPSKTSKMGLTIGSHVMLKYQNNNDEFGVARPYTPITNDFDDSLPNYFELMIKIYSKGKMTQYLNKLKVGQTIQIRKYIGKLKYDFCGHFNIRNVGNFYVKKIGMIGGGSGITPLLQVIRYINHNKHDIQVNLLFANRSIKDILLRNELEAIHNDNDNKINVFFTVSNINKTERTEWNGNVGRIDIDMIRKYTFKPSKDVMMLLCGPTVMTQAMEPYLTEIGHHTDRVFTF
eukprot:313437_1